MIFLGLGIGDAPGAPLAAATLLAQLDSHRLRLPHPHRLASQAEIGLRGAAIAAIRAGAVTGALLP